MSEDGAFWEEFLRRLVARGLKGVRLVISDAHEGLKAAIKKILTGSAWQRCRVHFMRNVLTILYHFALSRTLKRFIQRYIGFEKQWYIFSKLL